MRVIIAGCHDAWDVRKCALYVQRAMVLFGFHGEHPCPDCAKAGRGDSARGGVPPCTHSTLVTEVIHGSAKGIDAAADDWAIVHWVTCTPYPANWDLHGKRAGPIRNSDMAERGDVLVAVWNGKTPGTRDMINQMARRGKPAYVVVLP